ncbi:hypothetical protein SKAU_G00327400 [Synaphobranchus kaupii]|uniref:Uncharacterized protein n=1 Tax=Synaphobranchus kaupii TaxID=118154 RepID=A0A9Q1IK60_SYNKA|nr:hypothetical protein SKAU_G00327400 [Synaphobranchus kaupii]
MKLGTMFQFSPHIIQFLHLKLFRYAPWPASSPPLLLVLLKTVCNSSAKLLQRGNSTRVSALLDSSHHEPSKYTGFGATGISVCFLGDERGFGCIVPLELHPFQWSLPPSVPAVRNAFWISRLWKRISMLCVSFSKKTKNRLIRMY